MQMRQRAELCVALALIGQALVACPRSPSRQGSAPASRSGDRAQAEEKALQAAEAQLTRPPLPLFDTNVHLEPTPSAMALALEVFAAVGVHKFAVRSAGSYGSARYGSTMYFANRLQERMAVFVNLDWNDVDEAGWGQREARHLVQAMREGASGLKIFKNLGLGVRLANGRLLAPDDARLDPIFRAAARTGAIVAWHVADPVAFFEPPTPQNERYEELSMAPDWSFYGQDFPTHRQLMEAQDRVIGRHPETRFVGVHLAGYAENLEYVADLLEKHPNLYVDVAARLGEIGRHPVTTLREFFLRFQDRILFATDFIVDGKRMQLGSVSPTPPTFSDAVVFYRRHRLFFETPVRQLDHPTPIQGRWKINGIDLPADVLKKIYYRNADRLIFAPRREWLQAHRQSR